MHRQPCGRLHHLLLPHRGRHRSGAHFMTSSCGLRMSCCTLSVMKQLQSKLTNSCQTWMGCCMGNSGKLSLVSCTMSSSCACYSNSCSTAMAFTLETHIKRDQIKISMCCRQTLLVVLLCKACLLQHSKHAEPCRCISLRINMC